MSYKALANIKIDGQQYKAGDLVELSDEAEAAALVNDGIIESADSQAASVAPVAAEQTTPPSPQVAPTPPAPVPANGPQSSQLDPTAEQIRRDIAAAEASSTLQSNG